MWNTGLFTGPEEKSWLRGVENIRLNFAIDCVKEWLENETVKLWRIGVYRYTNLEKMARGEGFLLVEGSGGVIRGGGNKEGDSGLLAGSEIFRRIRQVDFHVRW